MTQRLAPCVRLVTNMACLVCLCGAQCSPTQSIERSSPMKGESICCSLTASLHAQPNSYSALQELWHAKPRDIPAILRRYYLADGNFNAFFESNSRDQRVLNSVRLLDELRRRLLHWKEGEIRPPGTSPSVTQANLAVYARVLGLICTLPVPEVRVINGKFEPRNLLPNRESEIWEFVEQASLDMQIYLLQVLPARDNRPSLKRAASDLIMLTAATKAWSSAIAPIIQAELDQDSQSGGPLRGSNKKLTAIHARSLPKVKSLVGRLIRDLSY